LKSNKVYTFSLRRQEPESCDFGYHEWTFLDVGGWVKIESLLSSCANANIFKHYNSD